MRQIILATALIFLTTTNFGQVIVPQTQGRHVLAGHWKLVRLQDLKTKQTVQEPNNLKRSVVIKLEDDGHQGHIEGHTSRNNINGQYYLRNDNGINFVNVGTQGNENGERTWGDNLPQLLLDANTYKMGKDTLTITYDNGTKAMIFIPGNEKPEKENSIYK
jgi:hypothetical protein